MGYTVAVSARTPRLRDEMLEFLGTAYRTWSDVTNDEEYEHSFEPPTANLPSGGKCTLGFRYRPSSGPEREYNFAVMRWVAIQSGKRRCRFRSEDVRFDRPVHYYIYDGCEAWPILLNTEWPRVPDNLRWHLHDRLGIGVDASVHRELAWHHIPDHAYGVVTATMHGRSHEDITKALIATGSEGARKTLATIRAEVSRLDVLWQNR